MLDGNLLMMVAAQVSGDTLGRAEKFPKRLSKVIHIVLFGAGNRTNELLIISLLL